MLENNFQRTYSLPHSLLIFFLYIYGSTEGMKKEKNYELKIILTLNVYETLKTNSKTPI